jgi:hypothetical protein
VAVVDRNGAEAVSVGAVTGSGEAVAVEKWGRDWAVIRQWWGGGGAAMEP